VDATARAAPFLVKLRDQQPAGQHRHEGQGGGGQEMHKEIHGAHLGRMAKRQEPEGQESHGRAGDAQGLRRP